MSKSHKALLTRFQELTVLMSEAHNKLNTAVAKSGKAIAAGHSKVRIIGVQIHLDDVDCAQWITHGHVTCCYGHRHDCTFTRSHL